MTSSMPDPPAMLRVDVERTWYGLDGLTLPRPYFWRDGDETNALIAVGVNVGGKHADPVFAIGLALTIPPQLFWFLRLVRLW